VAPTQISLGDVRGDKARAPCNQYFHKDSSVWIANA